MIDLAFLAATFERLLAGVPLMLGLTGLSVLLGLGIAVVLAAMRQSGVTILDRFTRLYVFAIRGTPLLVQIFMFYYGLSQFVEIRQSVMWPFLREPFWCAVLALTLNTSAYGAEIVRGAIGAVGYGEIEAARAFGMSKITCWLRVILPLAARHALPAYGNELILMTRATALASVITLMEVTGTAHRIISETYRVVEVFLCAGVIYLAINALIALVIHLLERRMLPEHAPSGEAAPSPAIVIEKEFVT